MSTVHKYPTLGQVRRTLELFEELELTSDNVMGLHSSGHFVDLMRAIKKRTLPDRYAFRQLLGLVPEFPYLMGLEQGGYTSPDASRSALRQAGCHASLRAGEMLSRVDFTLRSRRRLFLVTASPQDLDFSRAPSYESFFHEARHFGLELVPQWAAPAIRAEYTNQPKGEKLVVAMNSILIPDQDMQLFSIFHTATGRELGNVNGGLTRYVELDALHIFAKRSS